MHVGSGKKQPVASWVFETEVAVEQVYNRLQLRVWQTHMVAKMWYKAQTHLHKCTGCCKPCTKLSMLAGHSYMSNLSAFQGIQFLVILGVEFSLPLPSQKKTTLSKPSQTSRQSRPSCLLR